MKTNNIFSGAEAGKRCAVAPLRGIRTSSTVLWAFDRWNSVGTVGSVALKCFFVALVRVCGGAAWMLNSSVGVSGEWLSTWKKMASWECCADCCWGSFGVESVHMSFTTNDDSHRGFQFLAFWLVRLPLCQPEPVDCHMNWMSHMFHKNHAQNQACSFTSSAFDKTDVAEFIVLTQSYSISLSI